MSSQWKVELGWLAQCDLRGMQWHDERDLGGCLFGRVDHERRHIYVERVHANPSGPHERYETWIDGKHFVGLERYDHGLKYPLKTSTPGPEFRIVGNVHSHPGASRGPVT